MQHKTAFSAGGTAPKPPTGGAKDKDLQLEYKRIKKRIDALADKYGPATLEARKRECLLESDLYMGFLEGVTTRPRAELECHIAECAEWLEMDEVLQAKFSELARHSAAGVATGEIRVHSYSLFVIVRSLKPALFLETGVANGKSSLMILEAMEKNQSGKLVSVDAATPEPSGTDRHKAPGFEIGWLVPDRLRKRWDLRIGYSTEVLPEIRDLEGRLDIFMHDSLSNAENMAFEYGEARRLLKPGGLLLSDDIEICDAFGNFAARHAEKTWCFGTLGAMRLK